METLVIVFSKSMHARGVLHLCDHHATTCSLPSHYLLAPQTLAYLLFSSSLTPPPPSSLSPFFSL
jgi:hypothetical protein